MKRNKTLKLDTSTLDGDESIIELLQYDLDQELINEILEIFRLSASVRKIKESTLENNESDEFLTFTIGS